MNNDTVSEYNIRYRKQILKGQCLNISAQILATNNKFCLEQNSKKIKEIIALADGLYFELIRQDWLRE